MHAKKRHHFVPKAYLRAFANDKGRVLVYRKDEPQKVLAVAPDATAFERYYYSQPTPEGGLDHNRLEDEFSKLEGVWPPLVSALHKGENVNDSLLNLFQFIILQRVRVPAARDATEARLAGEVHQLMLDLTASGRLPPPPPELAGRLDAVVVSIDPHKSIHGMVDDIKAAQWVFDNVGLCAIRNKTATPFLTSDNPVIWFDPSLPLADQEPYLGERALCASDEVERDLVLRVCVDGQEWYCDKAKYAAADELGVKRCRNGFHIDALHRSE